MKKIKMIKRRMDMKKFKSILSILLVFVLVMGLVSCGKTNTSETPDPTEKKELPELASTYKEFEKENTATITWFEQGWTGPEKEKDIVAPEIFRLTNLKLLYEPMTVPTGDDYVQKLNLMVSANEIPEIFFGGNDDYTRDIYKKLGENGKIWDLTEVITDYPNLYNLVTNELNLYKIEAGKNYFIPTQNGKGYNLVNEAPHGMGIRLDFLEKLGLEYPETPKELQTYLQRAKDEIKINGQGPLGIVLDENFGGIHNFYNMFFPYRSNPQGMQDLPINEDGKVVNYLFTNSDELKEAALYINGLFRAGLFDKEVLSIKKARAEENVASGLASISVSPWWDMNTFSDIAKETYPEHMLVMAPFIYANQEVKDGQEKPWTNWIGCWSSLIIRSDVKEEVVRHLLAVMDYLATTEGQLLVQAGIEGKTYTLDDEGKYEFTEQFKKDTNDLDWNATAAYGVFYYSQLVSNIPAIEEYTKENSSLIREDNKIGWDNRARDRELYDLNMEPLPEYYFISGPIEREKFSAISSEITAFWVTVFKAESEAQVLAAVDAWGEKTKKMGIDEIIAERQAIIDDIIQKLEQ